MDKRDLQLVEKCKLGNASAKEWLYKEYAPLLLGVCRRYINNRMLAEDVVHESFITIYEKLPDLKQESSVEGWMKKIVVNNSLKFIKNQKHFIDIDEVNESDIEVSSPEEDLKIKDQLLQLYILQETMLSVIDSLPVGFRTVFNLYVFEKYNHNEIALELGISAGTSRSQLQRARKMIQKKLVELVEKEKKEKVYLSPFILLMNEKLDYIDQIAFTKLEGFRIIPVSTPSFIKHSGIKSGGKVTTAIKVKTVMFSVKNIIWFSAVLGVTSASLIVFLPKRESSNQIGKEQKMASENRNSDVVKTDTVIFVPKATHNDCVEKDMSPTITTTDSFVVKDSVKMEEVVHKKVVMRKVITIMKKNIVTDTIKK
jgi:RNA polymerase sigma factor (sigma-70 family)